MTAVDKSFAEIAVDLRIIATSDKMSLDHAEHLWAKEGHPAFRQLKNELTARTNSLAAAYAIIRALCPHEVAVRRMLDMEVPNAGTVGERPRAGAVARTAGDRQRGT